MKVAVITPYHKARRDWLEQCHQSVLLQTYPCTHFLVADGYPEDYIDSWDAQHIVLKKCHSDFGDTPRGVGSMSAIGQGFDAIAYLDDDNWYHLHHIESMVKLQQKTKASICTSHRIIAHLDGHTLGECPFTHPHNFVDTSCYFIAKQAFQVATYWSFIPKKYHCLGDRLILLYIKKLKLKIAFSNLMTVAYRTKFPQDYVRFNQPLPEGVYSEADLLSIFQMCQKFQQATGIDIRIKQIRSIRSYDGQFWDGTIDNNSIR